MRFSLFAVAAALVGGALASNVVDLDPSNFDTLIGKGAPALVEFFAPWCGHCKNLAPVYEQVADAFAHVKDKVIIAKTDADGVGKPLGQKYGVTGYPTLKWFPGNGAEPIAYEGGRDLDAFAAYITKQVGVKSSIKPPPPPATTILDALTFDSIALDTSKNVLVSFTAPWCGHCKNMKPGYEKVAQAFAPESDCIVANVDADAAPNKPLAEKYGVSSYPTIKFFPKGSTEPIAYNGGRDEAAFTEFLNTHCGTHRAVGGGLNDLAGRVPELDALAARFFSASADARSAVYEEARALAETLGAGAKHYIKVMEKVVNGSDTYFTKETKRMGSILTKNTMAPSKLDEMKIKANILAAFAAQKAADLKDEVLETAENVKERVKEEL